ncbi:MAG TPA: serine/threonine-protein kinase [Polyangiaceae bacterium]|nr:serine/threonine-protein kinase [Polyangiaceae bacterium]
MLEMPVPAGTLIAGRYRVDRPLGAGTMGVVVAGWNLELDQPVAIKFLNPGVLGARDALERFRREVRAAAKIRSEHVTRVLDVGNLDSGLPYMVMELLDGQNLEEELTARGPLPVSEAVGYVLEAIEALAEAHAAQVVHRDLKPANLFISRRADRSRIVKVLDFGVSKTVGDSTNAVSEVGLTRTGMIIGSPLYMSPEQLRSTKTIDCRADIWALGAILFQLLTGHTPYDARSVAELCAMLLRDPPTPPSRYRGDLPLELEAVILRCLERDPADRYQNVSTLADALSPFAPPSARIHAERARGVILGAPESIRGPSYYDMASGQSGAESAPPTTPEAGHPHYVPIEAERAPLIATNGKTAASWGAEVQPEQRRRRKALWVSLAAASVIGLFVGGALHLRADPREAAAPSNSAASVAAAAPDPGEPPKQAAPAAVAPAPAAVTAETQATSAAAVPAAPGSGTPPVVEPVAAAKPAAAALLPGAARPAPALPKAAPAPNVPAANAPAPAPKPVGGLSDFGGRK